MKHAFCWAALLVVVALPALAACPPTALLCATPMSTAPQSSDPLRLNEQESTLWQAGAFRLERVDASDGGRFGLRPSWQLDGHTRLSFKVTKSKAELRLRVTW
ncbi:hypothetical protein ACFPAG_12835 [Vogesella sp. GCM10023246]|uniref:Uncharacterized protein n=1 Tax=Vogesella oryzagri TaxID=3160864 RepID=A0ABV1M5Z8_9NEIS